MAQITCLGSGSQWDHSGFRWWQHKIRQWGRVLNVYLRMLQNLSNCCEIPNCRESNYTKIMRVRVITTFWFGSSSNRFQTGLLQWEIANFELDHQQTISNQTTNELNQQSGSAWNRFNLVQNRTTATLPANAFITFMYFSLCSRTKKCVLPLVFSWKKDTDLKYDFGQNYSKNITCLCEHRVEVKGSPAWSPTQWDQWKISVHPWADLGVVALSPLGLEHLHHACHPHPLAGLPHMRTLHHRHSVRCFDRCSGHWFLLERQGPNRPKQRSLRLATMAKWKNSRWERWGSVQPGMIVANFWKFLKNRKIQARVSTRRVIPCLQSTQNTSLCLMMAHTLHSHMSHPCITSRHVYSH